MCILKLTFFFLFAEAILLAILEISTAFGNTFVFACIYTCVSKPSVWAFLFTSLLIDSVLYLQVVC